MYFGWTSSGRTNIAIQRDMSISFLTLRTLRPVRLTRWTLKLKQATDESLWSLIPTLRQAKSIKCMLRVSNFKMPHSLKVTWQISSYALLTSRTSMGIAGRETPLILISLMKMLKASGGANSLTRTSKAQTGCTHSGMTWMNPQYSAPILILCHSKCYTTVQTEEALSIVTSIMHTVLCINEAPTEVSWLETIMKDVPSF